MFQDFNILKFLILTSFCFLAAVIDAISGGGGLISLPAYFAVGFSPHVALGTNKVSSTLSTIASSFKFCKSKKELYAYKILSDKAVIVNKFLRIDFLSFYENNLNHWVWFVMNKI